MEDFIELINKYFVLIFVSIFIVPIAIFGFRGLVLKIKYYRSDVEVLEIIFMSLRKINPSIILKSLVALKDNGINIHHTKLQAHYLAGGDLNNFTEGFIYSKMNSLNLNSDSLFRYDLSEINLKQTMINFKEKNRLDELKKAWNLDDENISKK